MKFNELYKLIINEDSIENIELKGDWDSPKKYGYDNASIGILKNKNSLERIKNKWAKLEHPIDIYIAKGPKMHTFYELGRVDFYFVRDKMNLDITPNDDHITLIFTNNKGDEKVPLTPWVMAHRFGHAFSRDQVRRNGSDYMWKQTALTAHNLFSEVARIAYGMKLENNIYSFRDRKIKKHLAQALGTFKSARDQNIRNEAEFTNEIIAQYIINGKITLNRNLPDILPISHAWGKPSGPRKNKQLTDDQQEELQDIIEQKESELNYDVDSLFTSNIGHIFVM